MFLCSGEPSFRSVAALRERSEILRGTMQTAVVRREGRNKTAPNKVPAVRPSVFPGKYLQSDPYLEYPRQEIIMRLRGSLRIPNLSTGYDRNCGISCHLYIPYFYRRSHKSNIYRR